MRQQALIGAMLVAGAGVGAVAAPLPLGEDELKVAIGGKTVAIDTPLGLPITVTYGANGIMTGTAGTALAVYLGSAKDRGRWQIKNGKLCQKWFKWLAAETTCLTLRQDGAKIFWRSDEGKTGTAMIEPGPPTIDGTTASGLGLTQPPAAPRAAPAPAPLPAEPEVAQAPPVAANRAAPPARQDVVNAKPAQSARAPQPVEAPQQARVARPAPDQVAELLLASESTALELTEVPRQVTRPVAPVSPVRVAVEPAVARFAMASMMPVNPARQAEPTTSVEPAQPSDPFAADVHPMRRAADLAAIGVLEHRWCLANAFAKGPSMPGPAGEPMSSATEIADAPSLLSIAKEQAYDGELPLHEASCLTEEPAIKIAAKLAGADR